MDKYCIISDDILTDRFFQEKSFVQQMWPGNTTDAHSLIPVVERMKKRFHIGLFCVVCDCGMKPAVKG